MIIRRKLVASALAICVSAFAMTSVQAQSIAQALTASYDYAPDLKAAVLEAKATAENIALAASAKRPTIGASLGGTYNWSLVNNSFNDSSNITTGLSYNQTIFDNNQTEANIEAARAATQAAEYRIRNTEQSVLLEVIQAYMAVYSDRQLVDVRRENRSFYSAQQQSSEDRLEVGEGTRIDVAQARARLAQGEAAYRAALNSLEVSEATFQRYVGMAPGNLQIAHNYARLIPNSLPAAIAEAESGHPALMMARAAIHAAQASSDAAKAAFGPTAKISGTVGSRATLPSAAPTDGLSGSFGFQITVPIYAGGAIGASVRKANIEQIKSEVDALSAYDQIREAVISAWAGIQSAEAQIAAANAAVEASRTVVEGVVQERDLGTRTTLDVLNAQAELATAREALITAASNKVIATFSLLAAMGHLTAYDLGLDVQVKTAVHYTEAVEDVWAELRSIPE